MKIILLCSCLLIFGSLAGQTDDIFLADSRSVKAENKTIEDPRELELYSIDDRIRKSPKRLDFRFERINELSLLKDWKRFTNEIILLIDLSYTNNHDWQWDSQYDAIGNNAEQFVVSTVQDFIFMLYLTDDVKQHSNIRAISDAILDYQPKNVHFLSYHAMTYSVTKEYEKAIKYLLLAENIEPQNVVTLELLAENYLNLNMTDHAEDYLEKVMKVGGQKEKEEARLALNELKAK